MSEPLTVIACLRAKAGKEMQLRQELQCLVGPTLAEAGCIAYDLHESTSEAGSFMFHEVWRNSAALDAHFHTPHMIAISKLLPELLAGPMDLTKWTKL
jgi:quinol monooxygenase YgiN